MAAASPISDEALSAAASAPAVLEEIRDRAKALVQEDVVTKLRQGIPKLTSSLLETLERHEASPKLQEELWAALQPFQGSCLSSLGKLEDFAKSTLENLTRNVSISDLNLAARTLYQVLRKPPSPAASPTGSRAAPGSTAGGPAPTAPPKAARPAVPQPIASAPPAVPLRDHAAAWKPSTPAAAPAADAGGRERAAKRPRGDPDGSVAATASTRISTHASFSSQPRATAPAAAPKMPAAASHPPAATLPALPPAAAAAPAAAAKPHQAPVPVAPHPQPPQQQQPRPAAAASSPQVPTLTAAMLAGSPSPPGAANRTAQPTAQAKLLLRSAAAPVASAVPVATGPAIPGAGHATALLRLLQQQQQQGQPTAAAANVGRFVNLMQGKAIATSKPSLPAPTVTPPGTVPMRVAAHAAAGRLPASSPMPALVAGAPPAAYARATAAAPAPSPAAAKPAAHGPPAARQASPAVAAAQPQPAAGRAAAAAPAPAAAPTAAPASASASASGKQEDAAKGAETKLVALSWTATQDYLERLGHQVALGREVYGLVRPAQHGIPNPR